MQVGESFFFLEDWTAWKSGELGDQNLKLAILHPASWILVILCSWRPKLFWCNLTQTVNGEPIRHEHRTKHSIATKEPTFNFKRDHLSSLLL